MLSREYCGISKNTYFEEHLRTTASEVTLGGDCLRLPGQSLSKPSCPSNFTKTPVAFKPVL